MLPLLTILLLLLYHGLEEDFPSTLCSSLAFYPLVISSWILQCQAQKHKLLLIIISLSPTSHQQKGSLQQIWLHPIPETAPPPPPPPQPPPRPLTEHAGATGASWNRDRPALRRREASRPDWPQPIAPLKKKDIHDGRWKKIWKWLVREVSYLLVWLHFFFFFCPRNLYSYHMDHICGMILWVWACNEYCFHNKEKLRRGIYRISGFN